MVTSLVIPVPPATCLVAEITRRYRGRLFRSRFPSGFLATQRICRRLHNTAFYDAPFTADIPRHQINVLTVPALSVAQWSMQPPCALASLREICASINRITLLIFSSDTALAHKKCSRRLF
ncbi:hypothetical protein F7P84_07180 [Edwardsiella anguillarum]|nr:hypothetical protein F7P84_07180 [Edwardsiella anguillarum]